MPEEQPQPAAAAQTRKLAAIMFTDIVGFSRQMGSNEARTLRLLDIHNQVIQQAVTVQRGTVIKIVGDAFLVDFPSVVHAVQCAQQIQNQFRSYNAEKEKTEQIHVRIGIHLGDVVQRDGDVFGDGVNIASRLQAFAAPDTVCVSDMVYRDVAQKIALGTVISLGRPKLKNITQRFPVYALLPEPPTGLRQVLRIQRLKLSRRVGTVVFVLVLVSVLLLGGIVTVRYFFLPIPNTQHLAPSTQAAPAALPLPAKPSIVVLPFKNMSSDSEQEYFSDGLTEVLTGDLSKISSLFVISRNSAFTYKGKAVKVQDVGREMGVRYVLEGSVLKAEGQVRITAQLIDTTTGGHLWSERYDRPFTEIFTVQDEVIQHIVAALRVEVVEAELARVRRVPTENLTAYDFLLRGGEYFGRFTRETNVQARQMYGRAIALDPMYAEAYGFLAWTYLREWQFPWSQDPQTLERAFELGQKAVALDDSLPHPHALLGHVYLWQKQYEQAIAQAERALSLDPNDDVGYWTLAFILNYAGRAEEAIGLMEKAMRLNPHYSGLYLWELGRSYFLTERHKEAIAALKSSLARNPDFSPAHINLAVTYSQLGREEEARAEAAEILRINPNFSLEVWRQRLPYKDPAVTERLVAALRKAGLK